MSICRWVSWSIRLTEYGKRNHALRTKNGFLATYNMLLPPSNGDMCFISHKKGNLPCIVSGVLTL